uniref:MFS transporter n=1 Tax=Cyberlindnera americana TaxID=36016 RepID=A0A5P8N8L0_9ASCO|nr:MFS transporter [Cyberlindnera americana]
MRYDSVPDSETTDEQFTPMLHHHMNKTQDKELEELEETWFVETQNMCAQLPWYKRPSKKLLYTVLSLHSLSFTVLMGPLVVLMLKSICSVPEPISTGSEHHMTMSSSSGMSSSNGAHLFARMDMGGGAPKGNFECKNKTSQQTLSNVQSILSLLSGVIGTALSGKFGQWSDVYGRVFVFKAFSVINVVYIIGLIIYFEIFDSYNQFLMIFILSINFLNGGVMTLIANGNSYLNDLVSAEDRTVAISMLMAFIYGTLGFGPLLGSLAVKKFDGNNSVILYIAFGFAIISMILIFGFLTETRHPEAQVYAKEKYSANVYSDDPILIRFWVSAKSFFHPIKRLWLPPSETGSLIPRRNLLCLVLIDVLVMSATVGTMSTLILYTIATYNWSSVELGYYMSIIGFGKAGVLLALAPLLMIFLMKTINLEVIPNAVDNVDRCSIILSSVFVVMSCTCITIWNSPSMIYLSAILQSLSGMMSPTIQAAVVKYSSKTTSGEMFGAMALLRHLAMLITPVFFLQIYKFTLDIWPTCFLYIAMGCGVVALVLSVLGLRPKEENE